MKKRIWITLILVLSMLLVGSVSVSAKSTSTQGTYDVVFGEGASTYSQYMSGIDYIGGYTDMTMTYRFNLGDDLKRLLEMGALEYRVDFYTKCGTSRTFSRDITVYCYDVNGNRIADGQYYIDETNYIVPTTVYTYESSNIKIPENTSYIMVTADLGCGTKQHMAVNGNMYVYKTAEDESFTDNTILSDTQFTMKEFYDFGSTEGTGLDINYYDIFENYSSRVPANNSVELFKKAVNNGGNLYYWSQLAYDLIKMGGDDNAYIKQNDKNSFDQEFGASAENGSRGYYFDFCADMGHQTAKEIENKNVFGSSSNLIHVTSFDDLLADVCDTLADHRAQLSNSKDSTPLQGSKFEEYHYMTKDGSKDGAAILDGSSDILYTYLACTDRVGGEQKFDYNAFIIAFYDFELVGVVNSDIIEMSSAFTDKTPTINTYFNDNPSEGVAETVRSWTYSESFSNTLTTGNTKTSEVTHGWNVNVGAKLGGREGSIMNKFNAEISLDLGASGNYTTSEAFSFEESTAQSQVYEQSSSSSLSAVMPEYTVAEIISTETEGVSSGVYDCPIAVTYKVAVISLNGRYYDDAVSTCTFGNYSHRTKVWLFGENSDAVKDIRERGKNGSLGNSDPLDWNKIRTYAAPNSTNTTNLLNGDFLINRLALHVPFTYEQATASLKGVYTTNTLKLYPCRPIYRTAVTGINTDVLHRNDVIYVRPGGIYDISSNISVNGYNDQAGEYYGFNPGLGYWDLAYLGGINVPDDVAKIIHDPSTGKTILIVDENAATAETKLPIYLTYHINDDAYNYYDTVNGLVDTTTKDSELAQKASLRVAIIETNNLTCTENTCLLEKYTDIDFAAWYHEPLEYAVTNKWMLGTSSSQMAPDKAVTRAMFTTILYRMAGEPSTSYLDDFTDTDKNAYYYNALRWAAEQGIVRGYGDHTFAPDRDISREEMVTMLSRFAQWQGYDTDAEVDLSVYTDADQIRDYAKDSMCFAVSTGLIRGTSDTTLEPQGIATRAQAARILLNYHDNIK